MLFGSSLSESEILNHAVDKQHRAEQDNKHSSVLLHQYRESTILKWSFRISSNYRRNMVLNNNTLSSRNIVFKLSLDQLIARK